MIGPPAGAGSVAQKIPGLGLQEPDSRASVLVPFPARDLRQARNSAPRQPIRRRTQDRKKSFGKHAAYSSFGIVLAWFLLVILCVRKRFVLALASGNYFYDVGWRRGRRRRGFLTASAAVLNRQLRPARGEQVRLLN